MVIVHCERCVVQGGVVQSEVSGQSSVNELVVTLCDFSIQRSICLRPVNGRE